MKRLTDTQADSLYTYLKSSIHPMDTLIQVSFETGCRVGELLLLHALSLDGDSILITPLKSSKPRRVKVSPNLLLKLRRFTPEAGKSFAGSCIQTRNLKSQRTALCRRFHKISLCHAGEKINFHALRHTAFSRLYAKTKDLLMVQDWAGHQSINSTLVYLKENRRDEADLAMSQILEGASK